MLPPDPSGLEPAPSAPFATEGRVRTVPHNVPLALSSFVGRARERDAVAEALVHARLVTITGPGGAGKTRLAREVAAAVVEAAAAGADAFADGVWWLELASVADGVQVPQAAAALLGVRAAPGRDVADAVADALHARRTLLVLDNCEHVVDAAAAFTERLLRAAPGVRVLATSREALAVEGESAWALPPLGTPPPALAGGRAAGAPTRRALADYEAVQLFVERARAAQPTFALTDANAAAVAAITTRLDGLPLALELAAVSVAALGVEQLAARLDDVFALLTRGRRTALPRHRTLRALLDWSHALLDGEERLLLARLAVFRGAFPLDAAEAVCADGPGDPPGVLPYDAFPAEPPLACAAVPGTLGRLVERSLVEVREQGGETRFRLLETVRQYALARLRERADAERRARARHAAWVEAFTAASVPGAWSPARGRTIRALEREVDEVRAALAWAAGPDGDVQTAVRIGGALDWFWFSGVPWGEARTLTDAALHAADAEAVPDASRPPAEQAALATLLYPIAGLAYFAGDPEAMLNPVRRGLALWAAVDAARAGDPALDAPLRAAAVRGRTVLEQLAGFAHSMRGEADAALRAMDAAVAAAQQGGDAYLHAVMRMRRALVSALLGRPRDAAADYAAAVPSLRALGETWFLSLALEGMATLALAAGDAAAAAAHARASVAVLRDEPDAWFVSRALDTLAAVAVLPSGDAGPAPARGATAARLLGAAAALRSACGAEVIGPDRARHAATTAAARGAAGPAAFDAAWAAGAALDLGGAIALAAGDGAASTVGDPVAGPTPPSAAGTLPGSVAGSPTMDAHDRAAPHGPAALVIDALGPLAVARHGVPLGVRELPTGNVTELLLLLVARPDGVTREQAGVALWPEASAARVRNAFHVTLHHLRRALGGVDGADQGWITFADGRYRLAREVAPGARLDCDVDAVLAAAGRLCRAEPRREPLDVDALAAAAAAFGRARGPFGEATAGGDWLVEVQDAVLAAWADGMHALARQYARAGRIAEGAATLAALVARVPLREGAHRELMVLWAAGGERARALGHYDALVERLRRDVGAAPARETRALADRIRGA
ncbi:hypothetical protein tb265_47420 [Gemmatimonadetes bacterium T265]|nr:hypothetical protein tb265_47420 [Gemmatimonadetes bacterium T265]